MPYMGFLVLTMMLAGYGTYIGHVIDVEPYRIKGQPLGISIPILLFPIAVALWLIYRGRRSQNLLVNLFLVGLTVSWVVHSLIASTHNDMITHTVWLFIPVVLMVLFKTPTGAEGWQALLLIAWFAVVILVLTRVMEILNIVPMFSIPDVAATQWEKQNYWLPLSGYLGLDGRWPGPFGFNSKTGFVSVFLVVMGAARWSKSSWVFVIVGGLGIVLTGGRGVYLSLLSGLLVLVLMSRRGPLARISVTARAAAGVGLVLVAGLLFFFSPLGTTGRIGDNGIWNSFLDLWRTSIWTGVGQQGIWNSVGRAHDAMDGHSLYVQEISKYGILGFTFQYLVLAVGVVVVVIAAIKGWSGPLAILVIYFVAGVTDLLHDGWSTHSMYTLMVILCVVSSGAFIQERRDPVPSEVNATLT